MVLTRTVDPPLERLIATWHDAGATREVPGLFSPESLSGDKPAQIVTATMTSSL